MIRRISKVLWVILAFAGFIKPVSVVAQLQVFQQDAQSLVNNVLVGTGVTVSNISFIGRPPMLGRFNGENSNIGLREGIIMSTGNIRDAVGPNNTDKAGVDMGQGGYFLLDPLVPGQVTKDAAVLSFDFVCEGDKVMFRYVFASEEYPEYVNKGYNDVFAFFIQGPGIVGTRNIALIPGTNTPVTIDNVNAGSYSAYFVNNGDGINGGGSSVQFDGFTRPFVAEASVIPCQKYRIIMAIADVKDAIYDSAVFLEAESFSSPAGSISQTPSYINSSGELYEGCGYNRIKLFRTNQNRDPLTFYLETEGTAIPGVDYTMPPASVTLGADQDTVYFDIHAFADGIPEPNGETVRIIYRDTLCTRIDVKTLEFTIYDPPPELMVTASDKEPLKCPGVPVDLQAVISGGVPPYRVIWNNTNQGNPVTVYPDSTTRYVVQVTDQCGTVVTDETVVEIPGYFPMRMHTSPDTVVCVGQRLLLHATITGGKEPRTFFWQGQPTTSPYFEVEPTEDTEYTVVVTDSCGVSVSQTIRVEVLAVKAMYDIRYTDNSTVQFRDLSFEDIVKWSWNFGDDSVSDHQNPLHTFPDTGRYIVELVVEDARGCRDTIQNPIKSYPPFSFWIPTAFTPDGDGINDFFSGVGEGFVTYEMYIYNRWGEMIFHTDNYNEKWGQVGRNIMIDNIPIDTYVYKIILYTPTEERKEFIGRITVIR